MQPVEALNSQLDDFLKLLRIVCFSESYKNLPMWWFYADRRKGVCLEFDTEHLNSELKLFTFPINYTNKLPDAIKTLNKFEKLKSRMSKENWEFQGLVGTAIYNE